ncbi:MAG: aldehyde dehydrogenase family protein [Bacteroidales bacterium]|nr:aldehyde dehydrogenase family protein [Bacteroidales bacterium]
MENTAAAKINELYQAQRAFFKSGTSLDPKWRKARLKEFLAAMEKWEKPLCDALWTDLHKSYKEAYLTEISLVKGEIRTAIKNVRRWSRRECKLSSMAVLPGRSYIVKEPLGTALIVSPWNYPVQLLLSPLVGAMAAGCNAVLKPSPYVPNVSRVIEQMIADTFVPEYITVVQGNREVNRQLFDLRWDMIFFTGSPALAHEVMAAAAKNLTPVVLELGGKSPCIVDKDADIRLAARRIAWGKTLNSGQTCIAPDYILIHSSVKEAFVREFARQVQLLHGEDVQQDEHYVRMVSDKAFNRVNSYLSEGKVIYGGTVNASERYIQPTLLADVPLDSKVMTEEIFGPVFPVIELDDNGGTSFQEKVISFVTEREKPLAFYYFGSEKAAWKVIGRTSSGGACINDTIMHITNPHIPFGGVGNSGMGSYHHKLSLDAFSHRRAVVASPTWIDMPFKYQPFRLFSISKKLL